MNAFIRNYFRRRNEDSNGIKIIQAELRYAEKKNLLSDAEMNAITNALPDLETESILKFSWLKALNYHLEELWDPELKLQHEKEEAEREAKAEEWAKAHPKGSGTSHIRYSIARPEWYIGLTADFNKAISKIDKKLQGRILEALGNIVSAPLSRVGNTLKPLTGNKKGLWRYRIGNYRLIYQPDQNTKHILLLTVLPRGSAYE